MPGVEFLDSLKALESTENTTLIKRRRTAMKRKIKLSIATVLAVLCGTVVYAQDK